MAGQFRCPGAGGALLPGGAALDGPRGWLGNPTVLGKGLEMCPQEESRGPGSPEQSRCTGESRAGPCWVGSGGAGQEQAMLPGCKFTLAVKC